MNPGDIIGGKYRIIRRLGGGAYGEVYLANELALECETAIKILQTNNPQETLQKLQEARILERCRHKNIVSINEANLYNINGTAFVVLDIDAHLDGSIESELKSRWFSVKESCQRISEMLAGLQFAHTLGYLHRDIKPANILIDGDSTRLSDFGLATGAPGCLGSGQGYTPHCPPEFYSSHTTSVQSDVFASGVTLFRVINNISNWRVKISKIPNVVSHISSGTLVKKVGYEPYIPRRIKSIINKACNPIATTRYASASALKSDIDALRFDIEWKRTPAGEWFGVTGDDTFSFSVVKRRLGFDVIFQKNGRRVSQNSVTVTSAKDVDATIAGIVARTTLS